MLASEIREMTASDIATRITELQEERFRLRFRGATEQLEEPLRLRAIRRDVARLKTVLRQREMGEVATAPSATTKKAAKAPAKKRTAKKAASAGK
jgi:large subunit ribosomal protein L29